MSATEKIKSEIDLVEKVTKQIITLSSGIIVILITVLGYYFEYLHNQPDSWIWTTFWASISLLLSIIFGLLVYGALIGSVHATKKLQGANVYSSTIRFFAILQWGTFVVAIGLLICSLYQICSVQPPQIN